jgi:hypothetical protein
MTRNEVIRRLCKLHTKVGIHLNDYRFASDSFCDECTTDRPAFREEEYRNDGKSLEFIEKAVVAAIERRTAELGLLMPDIEERAEAVRDALEDLVGSVRARAQGVEP